MHPHINDTSFGSITINHEKFKYDVYILPDNHVEKRHKKLSKKIYGTSHKISKDEVKYIYREGVNALIIGPDNTVARRYRKKPLIFLKKGNAARIYFPHPRQYRHGTPPRVK